VAGHEITAKILNKLNKLESAQTGMQAELKMVSQAMNRLARTSEQIVELRAESLHMINAHKKIEQVHNELFNRLRSLETWKGCVDTKIKNTCNNVTDLQKTQRWVALTVIGALIVGFIGLGFGLARYEILNNRQPITNGALIHGR